MFVKSDIFTLSSNPRFFIFSTKKFFLDPSPTISNFQSGCFLDIYTNASIIYSNPFSSSNLPAVSMIFLSKLDFVSISNGSGLGITITLFKNESYISLSFCVNTTILSNLL